MFHIVIQYVLGISEGVARHVLEYDLCTNRATRVWGLYFWGSLLPYDSKCASFIGRCVYRPPIKLLIRPLLLSTTLICVFVSLVQLSIYELDPNLFEASFSLLVKLKLILGLHHYMSMFSLTKTSKT